MRRLLADPRSVTGGQKATVTAAAVLLCSGPLDAVAMETVPFAVRLILPLRVPTAASSGHIGELHVEHLTSS